MWRGTPYLPYVLRMICRLEGKCYKAPEISRKMLPSLSGLREKDVQDQIECFGEDIADFEHLIDVHEELEQMIVDEAIDHWDWEASLSEQCKHVQTFLNLEESLAESVLIKGEFLDHL